MGTISEKLTYLNETKSKLKDNINLTGAGLTNQTPFRQYATDLKTALLNILNNGIDTLYNNFPKTTGTGTNISLNNTLQAPMRSVINGDTEQKSYSGKNLLKNHATSKTAAGITFTVNDDGSIVANGTSTESISFIVPQNYNQSPLMPAGTYTVSFTNKMPSSASAVRVEASTTTSSSGRFLFRDIKNNDTSYTFTTNQDFYLAISYIIRETTVDNFYNMIQVETGSSATEIEPYVGEQPSPSPDYPQEIKSVTGLQKVSVEGKNLLNASQESYTFEANTNTTLDNIGTIYLEANKKYYITYNIDNATTSNTRNTPFVRLGSASRIYQSATSNYNLTTGRKTWEYTPSESGNYNIGYWCVTPDIDLTVSDFMISTSNDITYEPYQTPQEYEINLGKNILNIESTDINSSACTGETSNNNLILTSTSQNTGYYGFYIRNIKPNTEYTLSYNAIAEYYAGYQIRSYNKNNVNTVLKGLTSATDLSYTFTTPSDSSYLLIFLYVSNNTSVTIGQKTTYSNIQLEEGSQSSYSPYFTPIHLYEGDQIIGTPNNWSIKHVMGEVVLDGSDMTNIAVFNANYGSFKISNFENGYGTDSSVLEEIFSNYLSAKKQAEVYSGTIGIAGLGGNVKALYLCFGANSGLSSIGLLQTWLSTHNTKVVYELAEPTTEPITNTELIEDLNNFYNAKSYNGQTNISVEGDLQMILDVSAIIDE